MNISSLAIEEAIIHEITDRVLAPPRPPELLLSQALSPLDDDLREYFQARIAESLRLAAFPVVADPDRESPTPDLVHQQFSDVQADFVELSKALARHLFEAQQKVRSSPGLLVISRGSLDTGPCIAILKLQKQEGLNLEPVGQRGSETYSLEHLHRLMLTNETRVFKVALFEREGVIEADDIYALVSDKQRFSSPEKRMADFFLQKFLGCRLRDDPAQTTNSYFVRVEKFLNERIGSPEKRARYHRALLTDLTSQANMVMPRNFANEQLEEEDRRAFLDFVQAGSVSVSRFEKNTELIETRLREEEYVLESGIRVRGSQDAFDKHADIAERDGELLEMLITDRLETVKGAPRRR
jgi:hypothetical protein